MFPLKSVILAVGFSLATLFALSRQPADLWDTWQPATCLNTGCFCEAANPHSPIKQTANTVSSLAFVFSGMFIMGRRRASRLPYLYSVIMALSSLIIGVGSAFYHASLTFSGQFFDVFGMFLFAAFMLLYALERMYTLRLQTTLSLFLLFNLSLSGLQILIPETRRYAFAIVLILALLLEHYYHLKAKPIIATQPLRLGLALLTVAYIIWILDNTRLMCFEISLLQGHAIWHILGAVAVVLLHDYYVSEKISSLRTTLVE